jgi:hypothetical protein
MRDCYGAELYKGDFIFASYVHLDKEIYGVIQYIAINDETAIFMSNNRVHAVTSPYVKKLSEEEYMLYLLEN